MTPLQPYGCHMCAHRDALSESSLLSGHALELILACALGSGEGLLSLTQAGGCVLALPGGLGALLCQLPLHPLHLALQVAHLHSAYT